MCVVCDLTVVQSSSVCGVTSQCVLLYGINYTYEKRLLK